MPIYEYECGSCGERTEAIQGRAEAPLTICPRCGGPLRKLFSAPSFQFKGSGWYATDYAGKKGGGGEEKKAGGEATEGKSDAKPAEGDSKASGESAKPAADAGSSKAGTKGESE